MARPSEREGGAGAEAESQSQQSSSSSFFQRRQSYALMNAAKSEVS